MCGRFLQLPLQFPEQAPWPELAQELAELTARYNLAPTQRAAVVLDDTDDMKVRRLRWGLLPFWTKDLKSGASMINARIETVAGINPREPSMQLVRLRTWSMSSGPAVRTPRKTVTDSTASQSNEASKCRQKPGRFNLVTPIIANRTQSRTLAVLRDTLLPRLLGKEL